MKQTLAENRTITLKIICHTGRKLSETGLGLCAVFPHLPKGCRGRGRIKTKCGLDERGLADSSPSFHFLLLTHSCLCNRRHRELKERPGVFLYKRINWEVFLLYSHIKAIVQNSPAYIQVGEGMTSCIGYVRMCECGCLCLYVLTCANMCAFQVDITEWGARLTPSHRPLCPLSPVSSRCPRGCFPGRALPA